MSLPTNFFIGRGGGAAVEFSIFTFTNGNTYGPLGPTRTQALSTYDTVSNPWLNDTSIYDVSNNGTQKYVIQKAGTYKFIARGAVNTRKFDSPTYRANTVPVIAGEYSLNVGDTLWIAVGQIGSTSNSRQTYTTWTTQWANESNRDHIMAAGCGGTSVGISSTLSSATPLICAGGGGGIGGSQQSNTNRNNMDGNLLTSGHNGNLGVGGTNGNGGHGSDWGGRNYGGGGGGGFYTDGQYDTGYGNGGDSFRNDGRGGLLVYQASGGFGGGGSGQENDEPAGGGGYSGGGGGGYNGDGSPISTRYGGGGGSFYSPLSNVVTSEYTAGTNPEHGYLYLEKL